MKYNVVVDEFMIGCCCCYEMFLLITKIKVMILVTIVARNLKKKQPPFSRACLSKNDKASIPCL